MAKDPSKLTKEKACEDSEVGTSVQEIRKANNIIELNNTTQLFEWYYDEITECAILRCLPCFELHVFSRPTLRPLTLFRAQQLLIQQEVAPSHHVITKRGIVRRTIVLITFVSLNVDRQNTKKQWRNIERRGSSKRELLQRAGTSLEQQSPMLSLGSRKTL